MYFDAQSKTLNVTASLRELRGKEQVQIFQWLMQEFGITEKLNKETLKILDEILRKEWEK